ncbi:hypothetical protein [Novosphingobium sp. EMRT-2]|uniref:hypothetical protein n=1 Tax=Novosphingobium sp. EMRT-2 TaxID=2571749 RepID=UPI0010BDDFA4|nr:hypothetical protein [Novosphingobium sp. EMRT-2]QCI92590.1 hypothetical protein FA702_02820 [Novosphingobium sp. EMRT-2]
MIKRNPITTILFVVAIIAAFDVALMASGRRLLIGEEYIPETEGFGYIPPSEAKFECTYFTGRRKVHKSLSANQYDECPLIWSEN